MSFYDVLELLYEESSASEALTIGLALLLVYLQVFKHRFHSIFDPLVYVLALSAVSLGLLLLMGLHGAVEPGKVIFVLTTLGLFYGGFLVADRSGRRSAPASSPVLAPVSVKPITLCVLFWANFLLLAITYAFFGIPLFLESRLAQFADSGGFGVLGRLTTGLEFGTVTLAFIAINERSRGRVWAKATLVQFVVSALLSGSKGALLTALFARYLAHVYRKGHWSVATTFSRPMAGLVALVVATPLIVIQVQNFEAATSFSALLQLLALRIGAEGDAYAYFLGGNMIDNVARHDWIAPIRPVLAAFRLVGSETLVNPGYEIVREVLGVENPSTGPNSRLAIYLLYFYGYGGIVLAPLLGMLLGVIRKRVLRMTRASPIAFAVAAAVYFHFCKLEVDPQLTIAGLFGVALVLPLFWVAKTLGASQTISVRLAPSGLVTSTLSRE